jgi:hypothetical protein
MKPYRQAHRPEPRWRWYAGLAVESAIVLGLIVAVAVVAGLAR